MPYANCKGEWAGLTKANDASNKVKALGGPLPESVLISLKRELACQRKGGGWWACKVGANAKATSSPRPTTSVVGGAWVAVAGTTTCDPRES